jgi:hypothetical protein
LMVGPSNVTGTKLWKETSWVAGLQVLKNIHKVISDVLFQDVFRSKLGFP